MKISTTLSIFLRTYCAIGAAICIAAIYQTQVQTEALLKLRTRYKWVILMAILAANAVAALYVVVRKSRAPGFWEKLQISQPSGVFRILAGAALLIAPIPLFVYARADFFGRGLEGFFRLLWLYWWLVLLQAAGLRLVTGLNWAPATAMGLLADGMAAQIYTLGLGVSNYPFSIGWSEASRYYYGSLVFSKALYGESLPLSVMHGSRYLLQSLPFALGSIPIWAARSWQVLLWIGMTVAASLAIRERVDDSRKIGTLLLVGWLFLFFLQGAVYYHLQVCVILIMLGVDPGRPARSLVAVVLASIWAGMSRLNWFPVPAMLAITLYLLERPVSGSRRLWDYLRVPGVWALVGLASALAGQALYVAISGNTDLEAFASSLTSDLLWYRWLPSPTNPLGIIPGVLIVSAPVWALFGWWLRRRGALVHAWRLAALGGMFLVLLAGGLVVSTKIGGGGDLHNMDAYLVLLALLGAYVLGERVAMEGRRGAAGGEPPWPIIASVLLVPVAFALLRLGTPFRYDRGSAAADLSALRAAVAEHARAGEVLFMYERHLLAFGMMPPIRMIGDYEVVTLMEMAISGNEAYLQRYYSDLANHRFSAVVAHPQNLGVETGDFIEENDAWSRLVAQPLLCQYKPALTLDYSNVQVLVPRDRSCPEFPPRIAEP